MIDNKIFNGLNFRCGQLCPLLSLCLYISPPFSLLFSFCLLLSPSLSHSPPPPVLIYFRLSSLDLFIYFGLSSLHCFLSLALSSCRYLSPPPSLTFSVCLHLSPPLSHSPPNTLSPFPSPSFRPYSFQMRYSLFTGIKGTM